MLLLEVVSEHAASMGPAAQRLVDFSEVALFRMGRGEHNDWVLTPPTISREQAVIVGFNGLYMLKPIGRQPVALNHWQRRLARESLVRLAPGDLILIDDVEILVSEVAGHDPDAPPFDPAPIPSTSTPYAIIDDPGPLPLIGETERTAVSPSPEFVALSRPWHEDDVKDPKPTNPASPASTGGLDPVWRAAGLDPERVKSTPASASELGRALRAAISGLRDGLEARNAVRRGYRVPVSQLAAKRNNPLKSSADAAAALEELLIARHEGFLGLADAVEEAFRDLRNHQLAVLKGEEAAFEAILAKFDPNRLERQLNQSEGRSAAVLARVARGKLWSAYRERYAELRSDEERAFRKLFSEPFAKAYERELSRLQRPHPAPDGGGAC